jgi:small subunit ribosomal protein S16
MIMIRMARNGRTKKPVYTIVATNSRSARDGKFIEKLGQYNPSDKEALRYLNVEGISNWVKKGAKLSDTVSSLLKKHSVKLS